MNLFLVRGSSAHHCVYYTVIVWNTAWTREANRTLSVQYIFYFYVSSRMYTIHYLRFFAFRTVSSSILLSQIRLNALWCQNHVCGEMDDRVRKPNTTIHQKTEPQHRKVVWDQSLRLTMFRGMFQYEGENQFSRNISHFLKRVAYVVGLGSAGEVRNNHKKQVTMTCLAKARKWITLY